MENETDVIKQQMLETRTHLAEKIEALEEKVASQVTATTEAVTQTVEGVKNTVEGVKDAVESTVGVVKDTVESTVESVKDTFESASSAVSETVSSTVETVRNALDVPAWLQNPWVLLGGSVLLGYVGGRLLGPVSAPSSSGFGTGPWHGGSRSQPATSFGYARPQASAPDQAATHSTNGAGQAPASTQGSWLGEVTGALAPAMDSLKSLAIGTLGGVVSEMVSSSLPDELGREVKNVVEQVTTSLGGKPIHVPLGDEGQHHEGGSQQQHDDQPAHSYA